MAATLHIAGGRSSNGQWWGCGQPCATASESYHAWESIQYQQTIQPQLPIYTQIKSLYSLAEHIRTTIMSVSNALPADAAKAAKYASRQLSILSESSRNEALTTIHSALSQAKNEILAANSRDLQLAQQSAKQGQLSASLVSRLDLGKKGKWEDMLKGILDVRDLEDPGMLYRPKDFPFKYKLINVRSREGHTADPPRRRIGVGASNMSNWRPIDHLRGSSGGDCKHRSTGDQVRKCRYSKRYAVEIPFIKRPVYLTRSIRWEGVHRVIHRNFESHFVSPENDKGPERCHTIDYDQRCRERAPWAGAVH